MFNQQASPDNRFLSDIEALRRAARPLLAPDRPDPVSDTSRAIGLLQTVLSAEIICVLRYTDIAVSPEGLKNGWIGREFQAQANDERRHMDRAAERIAELGGTPDFCAATPAGVPSHGGLAARVAENLAAEQAVIAHYRELITYFEPRDRQTCAMLRDIIRDEEDHTTDMQDLLAAYMG